MGYSPSKPFGESRPPLEYRPAPYETGEYLGKEQIHHSGWDHSQAHDPQPVVRSAPPSMYPTEGVFITMESPTRIRALAAMGIGGMPSAGAYTGRIEATVAATRVEPTPEEVARVIGEAELLTLADLARTLPSALLGERALVGAGSGR